MFDMSTLRPVRRARTGGPRFARPHRGSGTAVFTLMLCLFATIASADTSTTFHVDNTHPLASPAGPGTPGRPYDSINAALAAHHDTTTIVLVHPGLYRERVAVPGSGNARHKLTIRATAPGVILDGADDFSSPGLWQRFIAGTWRASSVDCGQPT